MGGAEHCLEVAAEFSPESECNGLAEDCREQPGVGEGLRREGAAELSRETVCNCLAEDCREQPGVGEEGLTGCGVLGERGPITAMPFVSLSKLKERSGRVAGRRLGAVKKVPWFRPAT